MSAEVASRARRAKVRRSTRETSVEVELCLEPAEVAQASAGAGPQIAVHTGVPFFDHLLEALARHGGMELRLQTSGDLEVGAHHTVEDTGLALGEAARAALYGRRDVAAAQAAPGVVRFGHAVVPMDDALVLSAVDLSGRSHCALSGFEGPAPAGGFHPSLWTSFCGGLAAGGLITLHQRVLAGEDGHHLLEAAAKSLGLALAAAWRPAGGAGRSTKGAVRLEVRC